MKILAWTLGALAALVAIVAGVGILLPVRHRASRQATFPASPDVVFGAITKVEDFPTWRSVVTKVDVISSAPEKPSWRETGSNGAIVFVAEQVSAPKTLVTRIADRSLPFGGTWTYELTPVAGGTTLRITEDGEVYNPIFRFMSRFVFGHTSTIDTYLRDLGGKLSS